MDIGTARAVLLLTSDRLVIASLERVADSAGLRMTGRPGAGPDLAEPGGAGPAFDEPAPAAGDEPDVVVVDLDAADAITVVRSARARYPNAFLAGHLGAPRRDIWLEADRAGCDLVANRGALVAQLLQNLGSIGKPRLVRFALAEAADLPGRIGVVARKDDSPVGPIALYQVRGGLYAVEDRCPHAGARLSSGELEGAVVTCPGHGSQFDVRTGERVRGPADCPLAVFEVSEESGLVYAVFKREEGS